MPEKPLKTLRSRKPAKSVFPIDNILCQLVSLIPGACLGILLLFQTSGLVICDKILVLGGFSRVGSSLFEFHS